jgi:uncharacterized coiled-coil protein SlyX
MVPRMPASSSPTPEPSAAGAAPESAELTERLLDLEVRLAYQDRQVRALDALVREFADRLDAAERELKQLKQALASPDAGIGSATERPPHY